MNDITSAQVSYGRISERLRSGWKRKEINSSGNRFPSTITEVITEQNRRAFHTIHVLYQHSSNTFTAVIFKNKIKILI